MRTGSLRDTITVQSPTDTISDSGAVSQTWADVATLRAAQVKRSDDDMAKAMGNVTERAIVFRTHLYSGVTLADRVSFEGSAFAIKRLVPDSRRRTLELWVLRTGAA
jgi:SPP1 family predicted phage head-tail adaptor